MSHSIFVNHTFLVSVTLTNGSRSLLKSSVNIRNDILLAMHFITVTSVSFSFVEWPWNGYNLERWGSIKVNEYFFIKWSKPFALSTYFFASVIMGPFRNSIGHLHSIPDKFLCYVYTDILDFLQIPFQATEISEIQILVIMPRLSPLLKLPVHFCST